MPYIYEISFDIDSDDMDQLIMGRSVQRSVGYLKALLPSEVGYITSRGMFSLSHEKVTHIIFQSVWEDWDTLLGHRENSPLDEHKLINEFQMDVRIKNLVTHVYEEIS